MILITIKQTLNAQPKQIISTLLDHQQLVQQLVYLFQLDKPVANHQGNIYLSANKDINTLVTELNYCISCSAPWWMPNALLKYAITKDITQALNNLNNYFLAGKV